MKDLKIFVNLTRLNRPIGYLLLFWPCSWGLAYAYSLNENIETFLFYIVLFFLGAVLMRSAGCIVNDIVDRKLDKKVKRTQGRPLASNLISVEKAFVYVIILCGLAFCVLIQFNILTVALGLASMSLAFSYPFMKRITYWPQLFLGITFNWGIIMAWTAMNNSISMEIIILYIAAIFWTLGYDTIYGAQDMSDDEIIGLKSTSIKFKNNIKLFVAAVYSISVSFIFFIFKNEFGVNVFTLFFMIFSISLFCQVLAFKKNRSENYLKLFKFNNYSGLILFIGIFSIKI